jgi:hypothetical protein
MVVKIRQDSNSLESLFKSIIMKKIECCTLPINDFGSTELGVYGVFDTEKSTLE